MLLDSVELFLAQGGGRHDCLGTQMKRARTLGQLRDFYIAWGAEVAWWICFCRVQQHMLHAATISPIRSRALLGRTAGPKIARGVVWAVCQGEIMALWQTRLSVSAMWSLAGSPVYMFPMFGPFVSPPGLSARSPCGSRDGGGGWLCVTVVCWAGVVPDVALFESLSYFLPAERSAKDVVGSSARST